MISINGKVYHGNNLTIRGNDVFIDGQRIDDGKPDADNILRVEIIGSPVSVTSDCSVSVTGNVEGDISAGSSVNCGAVSGMVRAGTSVTCGDVGSTAKAGTSISCKKIGGNAVAGTSIKKLLS